MKSLGILLALLAIATEASEAQNDSLQIQLAVKGYESDIKRSGFLDEWEVEIESAANGTTLPPQHFNPPSYVAMFPVSAAQVSKLYCVPEFLGDFLIWPHQITAPLQSSLVEVEVKRISDFLRIFVESNKRGITSMLARKRWQEASNIYEDLTNMLHDAKLQKIVTVPRACL